MYPRTLKLALDALTIAYPRIHRHLIGGEDLAQVKAAIDALKEEAPVLHASERCVAALRALVTATGGCPPDAIKAELVEAEQAVAELDAELAWTPADTVAAAARGWALRQAYEGRWYIESTDSDVAPDDTAHSIAGGTVLAAAMRGDPLARKAIAFGLCRAQAQ